jgi:trk system potassium uptake protein
MIKYNFEDLKLILSNIGNLLGLTSFLFLIPCLVVMIYNEPTIYLYTYLALAIFSMALSQLLKFKYTVTPGLRHAVITTGLFWIVFNIISALPLIIVERLSFINALFEAVSATTTTGLSVIAHPEFLMHSTLFWRSLLSWIGGLGIVILAILGVFAAYSKIKYFAAAEGRSDLLLSNIRKTITKFWIIYIILTVIGIIALMIAGMPLFESINYSFTSISTTGVDIHSGGLEMYGSVAIYMITLLLMLIGAISFVSHYLAFKRRSLKVYLKDKEFNVILFLILFVFIISSLKYFKLLPFEKMYVIISSFTCGGLSIVPEAVLFLSPEFFKAALIFLMFIGGSTASTAGGIKVERFILILKGLWWRVKQIISPKNAYFAKKYGNTILSSNEMNKVYGFVFIYFLFILFSTFVLSLMGHSVLDSMFEVTSAQSNVGISLGITETLGAGGKLLLILNMLVGRLEIIPIFAFVSFLFLVRKSK